MAYIKNTILSLARLVLASAAMSIACILAKSEVYP
jgi:hypothetical protein